MILLLFAVISSQSVPADNGNILFKQYSTAQGLPNSMVHQITQDKNGFLWIATYYGLYRYDGYEIKPYKSDVHTPSLLPSNNVICLAVENDLLWIGTHEGLCRLDMRTNQMKDIPLPKFHKKRINNICITRDDNVYVGTIDALFHYDKRKKQLVQVNNAREFMQVEQICEDSNGDLLVATWENGLYRYMPSRKRMLHHPTIGGEHAFMSVFQDSQGVVWMGSYGSGLYRVTFSSDKKTVKTQCYNTSTFNSISSNNVYTICENPKTHTLWIGTLNGVGIMNLGDNSSFISYTNDSPVRHLPTTEVGTIYCDRNGTMWIGTKGTGIFKADARGSIFNTASLNGPNNKTTDIISCIFVDPEGGQWTGFNYGVKYQHGNNRQLVLGNKRPYHISYSRTTGHVLISAHKAGITECKGGNVIRQYTTQNCKFVPHDQVTMTIEDRHGNWWVASYSGIGVRYSDGRTYCLKDMRQFPSVMSRETTSLLEDNDGSLWIGTENDGVIHLYGDMQHPERMKYTIYDIQNRNIPVNTPLCFLLDKGGRIWLGTEGAGLCLYDNAKDRFCSVHEAYNLPGDMVGCIQEDNLGHLWLGTNQGIARIAISGKDKGTARIFTTEDGLPDNFFEQNASCQYNGLIYFGSSRGVVTLSSTMNTGPGSTSIATISNILIDGQPIESLNGSFREKLSLLSPAYIQDLHIPASVKSFTLVFSSLNYGGVHHDTFAYRLDGFEKKWHFIRGNERSACYTNIDAGHYVFELKAMNEDGNWSAMKKMNITVAPPFWMTWWAYLVYITLSGIIMILIVRGIRNRMMLQNRLKFEVTDGNLKLIMAHEQRQKDALQTKRQLTFEIKDLDYTDADEAFLKSAIACVNKHLADLDFNTSLLAEEMAMSRSTLFKKLKTLTGQNASGFIRNIRLKAACQILDRHPNIRISDLAFSVGFNDPKYFSLCFRKEFGVSPSDYVISSQS